MAARKKILIAVDGSPLSFHAVNYVAALCSQTPATVSLLHIFPMVSEEFLWQIDMDKGLESRIREKYHRFNNECYRVGQQLLDQAMQVFAKTGYPPEFTIRLLRRRQAGIARDIIAEAKAGYDAVVVGRRDVGKIETFLIGSVCSKVVQGMDAIPVWVIGGEILSRKMLLAVDASENSRKAVVSASSYAAQSGAEVTLFHAVRKFFPAANHHLTAAGEAIDAELQANLQQQIQQMFVEYQRCLEAEGVRPEKISTQCKLHSFSRASDILGTAREGGYGTIVMGRRGLSAVREFLMGRVTAKVLNGAEGLAVWIVP